MMTQPRQSKAFPSRRLLVVLAICLAVFLTVDYFGYFHTDPLQGLQGKALTQRIHWLFGLIFLPFVPLGLYVIHFGYRVIKTGAFPASDSRRIQPSRFQPDGAMRFRGWVIIVTGICLCGLAVYGALIFPHELEQLLNSPQ
ncbi:MAG: hypothetical protein ABFR65_08450 [Pseudomonadota bacterium]